MVNVKEYGAIGKVLDTTAVVIQGQDTVTLADAADWKVGATIGLRANATSVHRAKVTKVNGDVVTLDAAPSFNAAAAAASNDDSPAIQAALDAVGAVGGGICFVPTGTYRLGTPKFVGNLPLFVSSNTK